MLPSRPHGLQHVRRNGIDNMTKPRICHLTTVHDCNDNRIFFKECAALAAAGYQVTLLAPGTLLEPIAGIQVVSIKAASNRISRVLWISTCYAVVKTLAARCKVVHFHDPELIPAGLFLKLCGKIVVYDAHENLPRAILSKAYLGEGRIRRAVARVVGLVEQGAAMIFDGIVTARPDISENFPNRHPCTLRNFPKLSDLDKSGMVANLVKEKPAVIYVGGMSRIRGVKELIDAFGYLENVELWLLGSFSDDGFFQECQRSPGWKKARYFGKVQPYEVFGYISRADIGIITFWPEPNHLTTLATKPFEYMAKGLPLIMSDFPYWRSFFGDCAIYVDPKAPKEIAQAIRFMLNDPEGCRKSGARNREIIIKEYNWEVEQTKLLSLYERLAASSCGPS